MSRLPVLVSLLCLGACVVGPNYRAPQMASAGAWIEARDASEPDRQWWKGFDDPQLTTLLESAVAGAPDLRAARARVAEARAARQQAGEAGLPRGEATASYSRDRLSENGEIPIGHIPGFSRDLSLFDAGFDASWEVDLWGRNRRGVEAAAARLESAEAANRGALLSLRAEVARTYFTLRADQARLRSARVDAEAEQRDADLVARRFKAGEASRFDLSRQEAQARSTAATVPALEADTRADAFALARLLGRPPEAVSADLLAARPLPSPPAGLAVGVRSEILRRRPDVIQAERNLAAATADIGVATADLFPRLSLAGSIGQQSQSLGDIASAGSTRFQAGPSVSWPILGRGTLRAAVRAANARADEAAAAYEDTVFAALADSETAVNRFLRSQVAERDAQGAVSAAHEALTLAEQRYRAGEDDLLPVLAAQSSAAQADQRLTDARLSQVNGAVAVFKALGI